MKLHFGYILMLFAIALAAAAGYISVVGWGKLFAGAATIVMIVMGIIESAKVITTVYLHKFGKLDRQDTKSLKFFPRLFKNIFNVNSYLTLAVIVTMILTSVGIYGFLTNAYQETATELDVNMKEVQIIENKKITFESKKTTLNDQIEFKNNQINTLVELRTQQENRLDSLLKNNHWTNVKRTQEQIAEAANDIKLLQGEVDTLITQTGAMNDSIAKLDIKILEMQSNSEAAAEIGPLKYISTLTGYPMDSVINYLVLMIIFIFDPMAIGLVIASNKVFERKARDKLGEPKPEPEPKKEPQGEVEDDSFDEYPIPEGKEELKENKIQKVVDAINKVEPDSDMLDFSLDFPEETVDEVTQYVESENGEFKKSDEVKQSITERIKGIESNPIYKNLIDIVFLDGARGVGDIIPPHPVFVKDMEDRGFSYDKDVVDNFFTVCNLLSILNMDDKDKVMIKLPYDEAKTLISMVAK